MEVKIEKGFLIIKMPLTDPKPSSSGKNMTVASTGGNVTTTCMHPDLKTPIKLGVNAYCAPAAK